MRSRSWCCTCSFLLSGPVAILVSIFAALWFDYEDSMLRHVKHVHVVAGHRTAVVTGSTTGIGFEAAKQFSLLGLHVVVHGSSANRTATAAAEVRKATKHSCGNVTDVAADLSDFDQVREMAARVIAALGTVNIILLNAGMMYGPGRFNPTYKQTVFARPPTDFIAKGGQDKLFAANHYGQFLLVRLLMPHLSSDARVIFLTGIGNWEGEMHRILTEVRPRWDLPQMRMKAYMAYHDSKLMNVCTSRALRRRLSGTQKSVIYDPGLVATAMGINRDSVWFKIGGFKKRDYSMFKHWAAPPDMGGQGMVELSFMGDDVDVDYVAPFWLPRPYMRLLFHFKGLKELLRCGHAHPQDVQKATYGHLHQTQGPACSEAEQEQLLALSSSEVGVDL